MMFRYVPTTTPTNYRLRRLALIRGKIRSSGSDDYDMYSRYQKLRMNSHFFFKSLIEMMELSYVFFTKSFVSIKKCVLFLVLDNT